MALTFARTAMLCLFILSEPFLTNTEMIVLMAFVGALMLKAGHEIVQRSCRRARACGARAALTRLRRLERPPEQSAQEVEDRA